MDFFSTIANDRTLWAGLTLFSAFIAFRLARRGLPNAKRFALLSLVFALLAATCGASRCPLPERGGPSPLFVGLEAECRTTPPSDAPLNR